MEPLGHNYIRSKIRALIPCIFHLNESQNNVLIFDANDSQAKSSLIFQNGLTHLGVYKYNEANGYNQTHTFQCHY